MQDNFIPLSIPNVDHEELNLVTECIENNQISAAGDFTTLFENKIKSFTNSKFAVSTNSGTSALHVSLIAIGVKPGDLVLIPSLTFIATANAVKLCGADPWLIDIEKENLTLNPSSLRLELENNSYSKNGITTHKLSGKRISAIVPVYVAGNPPNMIEIQNIAREFQIPCVVDAAGALGSSPNNKPLSEYGNCQIISFNGNKVITTGNGGVVCTNDDRLAYAVRHLSTTARISDNYEHDMVGFNYRLSNINSAIGVAQFRKLEYFLAKKEYVYNFYKNNILNPLLKPFPNGRYGASSYWLSGIFISKNTNISRNEIISKLNISKISARSFWNPIHLQIPYLNSIKGDLSNTESSHKKLITLPCSTNISNAELSRVVECLNDLQIESQ